MQKFNQKLIILYGSHNSGKSLVYNLFRKEDNFICLDLHTHHYKVYKRELLEQVGKKNFKTVKKLIMSSKTFKISYFLKTIGKLMRQYPDYNFVIKPGDRAMIVEDKLKDSWFYYVKYFTPLKPKNIEHLYILRHPKICLATTYHKNIDIKKFIKRCLDDYYYLKNHSDIYQLIKIEEIKHNKLFKELIKNTDLNSLLPYTNFDLNSYRLNIFDSFNIFESDVKVIESELKDLLKYLNYSIEDKNTFFYLKKLKLYKRI